MSKWRNYPKEPNREEKRLLFGFVLSLEFFEPCELHPRHFGCCRQVGLISSAFSKACQGCSPTSPPAAGRDKQGFSPWLGSYCCAAETLEGQTWHVHSSGNQLHDGLVSSSVQASKFSVFFSNSTPEQSPRSCRASFTCPTKKLKTWISLGWLRKCEIGFSSQP